MKEGNNRRRPDRCEKERQLDGVEMEDGLTAALSWMFMLGLAVIQVTHKHLSDIQDHSFAC